MNAAAPSSAPFLELENIGKSFGGTVALEDFDWSLFSGEVHCLVGENGSGKSTLIKIIAGVHQPNAQGKIVINDVSFDHLTPYQSKKLGIQVIYQDLSLFPNLSVWENIAIDQELGQPYSIVNRRLMREKAQIALKNLDVQMPLEMMVGQLSVAERQIIAICRGLATDAKLLFMDEPTASLTHHEVVRLVEIVRRLKNLNVAIVFVSHRLEEVIALAERITVLRDGRKVGTYRSSEVDHHRLVELMTGSRINNLVTARKVDTRAPILEVRYASRKGEFKDISFDLYKGEVLGVIGLLGSGRTELALSLFGMTRLHKGEIKLNGRPLRLQSNQDAVRAGIAYVSEDRLLLGLNLRQSISDNIAISVLKHLKNAFGFVTFRQRTNLAIDWLQRLNIKAANTTNAVHTLSGGNQQRVVLAKWLATDPQLLILDTPTAGVDVLNKQGIYDIVRELAGRGIAIILISDEVPEVYFNTDRILHLRAGRLAHEFTPGEIDEEALTEAVFA